MSYEYYVRILFILCSLFVRFLFALGAYFVLTLCSLGAYFVLTMALTGLLAAQAPLLQVNGSAPKTSNKHRKTNGTSISSTSENKRPRP